MEQNYNKARGISLVFVAIVAIVIACMVVGILSQPYDSGILIGTSLSGNNQYGGTVTAGNDYLFYVQNGGIVQEERDGDGVKTIYEGDVSYLNPYDGWLYFVEDGAIWRIAYYGGGKTQMGNVQNVTMMSVNGLWIYYLQQDGNIGKLQTNGQGQRLITDGKVKFTAFESANRIVVATDGKAIYRMRTDGTDLQTVAQGENITRMLYTLDNLVYCDNGQIHMIKSVEAGQDDGVKFDGLQAEVFTYDVDSENRGQIFYMKDDQLWVKKLRTPQKGHEEEKDIFLANAKHVTDLYSVASDVFYHTTSGELVRVYVSENRDKVQTQVEVVE